MTLGVLEMNFSTSEVILVWRSWILAERRFLHADCGDALGVGHGGELSGSGDVAHGGFILHVTFVCI